MPMVPFTGSVGSQYETRPVPRSFVNTPEPLGPLRLAMPIPTISGSDLSAPMVETSRVKLVPSGSVNVRVSHTLRSTSTGHGAYSTLNAATSGPFFRILLVFQLRDTHSLLSCQMPSPPAPRVRLTS